MLVPEVDVRNAIDRFPGEKLRASFAVWLCSAIARAREAQGGESRLVVLESGKAAEADYQSAAD
jgi:hypothetical protein